MATEGVCLGLGCLGFRICNAYAQYAFHLYVEYT